MTEHWAGKPISSGTYTCGCRCDGCRAARAAYSKTRQMRANDLRRARRRAGRLLVAADRISAVLADLDAGVIDQIDYAAAKHVRDQLVLEALDTPQTHAAPKPEDDRPL